MKLSEMKARKSGLPEGFTGTKRNWQDVKGDFEVVRVCIRRKPVLNEDGSVMTYTQGEIAGQTVYDRQVVLQIVTTDDKEFLVYTNSPKLTGLFREGLEDEPVMKNIFGDEIFVREAPEGLLHFIGVTMEYKNGTKGQVCDLEEVEG